MKNKIGLLFLLFVIAFFTFNFKVDATDDLNPEIYLYGFGDDYEDDDYLTLYNTKTCYVAIKNIPVNERSNIHLFIEDESIAEVQEITYGDNPSTAITAKIKGKKLGTTNIIASLTYNGTDYTGKITTTVHQSNYRIFLHREDYNDLEVSIMKKNEKLKLVATLVYGMATHVGDISSDGAIWSSNNDNIVSVDNTGLITAIKEGNATITAKYKTEEGVTILSTYNIEVKNDNNSSIDSRIMFYFDEPGPAMILNSEEKFSIGLIEIPHTEKENIKFKVENENIAKIIKTEYDKGWADAIATVKYLSVGKTKLIATLDYKGETYTASYELNIKKNSSTPGGSNNNITVNPKTGTIFIVFVWIIGLSSIGCVFWNLKKT